MWGPLELEITVASEHQQEMNVGKQTWESLMINSLYKYMGEKWMEIKEHHRN